MNSFSHSLDWMVISVNFWNSSGAESCMSECNRSFEVCISFGCKTYKLSSQCEVVDVENSNGTVWNNLDKVFVPKTNSSKVQIMLSSTQMWLDVQLLALIYLKWIAPFHDAMHVLS